MTPIFFLLSNLNCFLPGSPWLRKDSGSTLFASSKQVSSTPRPSSSPHNIRAYNYVPFPLLCSSHSFWRYLGGADSKHGPCKPDLHPSDLTYSIPLLHPRRSEISKVLMLLARKGLSRARAQYASTLKNKGPLNSTALTCVNPKCISYLRVDLNTYLTYLRYKEGGQIR